jgi:hypothetical protein
MSVFNFFFLGVRPVLIVCFEYMIGTKIAKPGIILNTRDFSSVMLATQGMTYLQTDE